MKFSIDSEYENLVPNDIRVTDVNRYCLLTESYGVNESTNTIDAHWHEWLEVIYILEGEMTIEYEGGLFNVKKGEVCVIGSQALHKIVGAKGVYRFQCLHINNGFIIKNINSVVFSNKIFKINETEVFLKYFNNIVALINEKNAVAIMKYKANILLLLSHCIEEKKLDKNENGNSPYSDSFTRILFYINIHFKEQLSLNDLSREYNYTPQYISSLFKKYLDVTFHTYLTKVRLDRAKFMLFSSNNKIIDIAYECGFPSEQSFIAQFKKVYGLTPASYRKKEGS